MWSGARPTAVARSASHSAAVCPGTAKIRSRLRLSNPAARAAASAATASAASWMRPNVRRWVSWKDCTPKLMRVTPAARRPRSLASSTVPGLASSVTSAAASTVQRARTAASRPAMVSGANSDGVPPPKKIVRTRPPAQAGSPAAARSSAIRASA